MAIFILEQFKDSAKLGVFFKPATFNRRLSFQKNLEYWNHNLALTFNTLSMSNLVVMPSMSSLFVYFQYKFSCERYKFIMEYLESTESIKNQYQKEKKTSILSLSLLSPTPILPLPTPIL